MVFCLWACKTRTMIVACRLGFLCVARFETRMMNYARHPSFICVLQALKLG